MSYVYKIVTSPVGDLKLVAGENGLAAILWPDDNPRRVKLGSPARDDNNAVLIETEKQLKEYFAGKRQAFTVRLDFNGTDFQKKVWTALMGIPFNETRTYGQIAREIGMPKASRAVGAAIGRNPISIITPCHRVIGTSGDLTGFAGGIETKKHLLRLEDYDQLALERGDSASKLASRWRVTAKAGESADAHA
jgi:methylated-DNA-[protein]-cysteine S-methyltransferase